MQSIVKNMELAPVGVMVSSTTQKGTNETIRALALGAVDFVSKTGGAISKIDSIKEEILTKCRNAASAHVRRSANISKPLVYSPKSESSSRRIEIRRRSGFSFTQKQSASQTSQTPQTVSPGKFQSAGKSTSQTSQTLTALPGKFQSAGKSTYQTPQAQTVSPGKFQSAGKKLVVIGTSTGGPQALQEVITRLPKNLPCGVVVVQHMPAGFTKSLADRLNSISSIAVKEAVNDEIIKAGQVYIAPGDFHLRIFPAPGGERKIVLSQEPRVGNLRPTVNYMFESAAQFGRDLVSVIMTGMGSDGCEGMKKIKAYGGYSIAQNEDTCVVYGMPKAVVDSGLADEIKPLDKIAEAIVNAVRS